MNAHQRRVARRKLEGARKPIPNWLKPNGPGVDENREANPGRDYLRHTRIMHELRRDLEEKENARLAKEMALAVLAEQKAAAEKLAAGVLKDCLQEPATDILENETPEPVVQQILDKPECNLPDPGNPGGKFQPGQVVKIISDTYGKRYENTKVTVIEMQAYQSYVVKSNRRVAPLVVGEEHLEEVK